MKLQIYAVLLLAVLPAALEGKRLKREREAAKLRAQKEAARAADAAPAFCPGPPGAFKLLKLLKLRFPLLANVLTLWRFCVGAQGA